MKKTISAMLAAALALSLTACGESLERPEAPTQTEPLWAMAPEERPVALTEIPTEPEETTAQEEVVIVAPTESMPEETTEATEVPTTVPAEPRYKMEDKFTPEEGDLYVKKGVNARDQANVKSNVIEILKQGEMVHKIGVSDDGWTAILREERVLYVSSEYLSEEKQEAPVNPNQITEEAMDDQVYTNHGVNMREGPGMDRTILVKVPEYTELHRIGSTSNGWYKVEYKDKVGYINGAYIVPKYVDSEEHPEETAVDEIVVTTREVNLRKGPSTERQILDRVPQGAEVHRIATTSNDWSRVIYQETEGYIASKYLEVKSSD